MSTRLPFARFEQRRDGYERWRTCERGRERYVYVHRLAAVAWGILDGLDDDRHVHHRNHIMWCNVEDNLEARDPVEHADYHLQGEPSFKPPARVEENSAAAERNQEQAGRERARTTL